MSTSSAAFRVAGDCGPSTRKRRRASGEDRIRAEKRGYTGARVDPFAVIILSGIVVVVVSVWLIGKYYPGSGMQQLGLSSAREIYETREALDAEDLDQMLAAANARRRARGEADLTVADFERRVEEDMREQTKRREAYLADRELEQLLEATNARRRARGLPERTREQVREEFGAGPSAHG